MDKTDTRRRLDRITDPGLFEELATAVLREMDPRCRLVAHVGTNPEGKTVPSPLDGIKYFSVEGERRMLAVHHTIQRKLRSKWLSEPGGDLPKTIGVFRTTQKQIPDLRATLILATNREPPEELIHEVEAAAHQAGIDVDIYPGSAIAHFLDTNPKGQWFRRNYLGVSQTTLSKELLRELSVKSVKEGMPGAEYWVPRAFDERLAIHSLHPVTFIVGESGMGKTVTCRKCLAAHVEDGGFGLLLTAEVLGGSHSLVDAVDATLRELHPPLAAGAGREALSLASETTPLVVVAEGVNRSASPAALLAKLAAWGRIAQKSDEPVRCRVLCPVWPRTTALLNDSAHKWVSNSSMQLSCFTEEEGIAAVQRYRAEPLSVLDAKAVAAALGYDPLLIALHGDDDSEPDPAAVVRSFVERSLARLAAGKGQYTAGEYLTALRSLSLELLERKQLKPSFADLIEWIGEQSTTAQKLREVVRAREVARLEGSGESESIVFRHDRVRDYLFADAVAGALRHGELSQSVTSDPYFAEVIGIALAGGEATKPEIDEVARVNPLALFSAMRHFQQPRTAAHQQIIDAASAWVYSKDSEAPGNDSLRHAVLWVLAECEGPHVRRFVERIDSAGHNWLGLRARFRNGDLSAGIALCAQNEPGAGWVGHVELIEHVIRRFRSGLLTSLDRVLRRRDLAIAGRKGALRLAGYTSSQLLAEVLRDSWRIDAARQELLSDYLWACAQCCGEQPAKLLNPVFDAWAALPDEDDNGHGSPRLSLGAAHLGWAFRDRVPESAIGYFHRRAMQPELRWPLLLMLNGIDHPDTVELIARELARQDEEGQGTTFGMTAVDEWKRRPTFGGNLMQTASRQRLRELWSCEDSGRHLRRHALKLWAATVRPRDLDVLKTVATSSEVGDVALFERLRRGDETAIPDLIPKLGGSKAGYWWQAGRYVWSDALTDCLDQALGRIADEGPDPVSNLWKHLWILPELLMKMPPATGERIIQKHWAKLCHSANYVQAALCFAGSGFQDKVREVVARCEDPQSLFRHTWHGFGTQMEGFTRLAQMDALVPYIDHLSDSDILSLWEVCNKNRWFDWRQRHLDVRAKEAGARFVDAESALEALDTELALSELFWPRLDQWGELLLKTGVSRDGIMNLLNDWLGRQREERALRLAYHLVTRFGKRRHVAVLQSHQSARTERGQAILDNASFALRQQSLE